MKILNNDTQNTRVTMKLEYTMLTIGPTTSPSWHEESLLIEKSISFRNLLLPIRIFCHAHNNLVGYYILWFCMFTSLHFIQDKTLFKMETLPLSWPVVGPSLGMI